MSKLLTGLDLTEAADAFAGTGKIRIKYKGETREIPVEIKGWEAVRDAYKEKHPEPEPPYRDEIIKQGTPEAKAFNIKGPTTVRRYDPSGAAFKKALRDWHAEMYYWLSAHCLKIDLTDGGLPITTIEKRVAALKKMGFSANMADQTTDLISALDSLAEEEAADFGEGGSEQPAS